MYNFGKKQGRSQQDVNLGTHLDVQRSTSLTNCTLGAQYIIIQC